MSDTHIYLSLIPQALVASMLAPEDFGHYYATGKQAHTQGNALFFEVDPTFRSSDFPFHILPRRCVPGPTGEPKKSVYLGIYRVLSRIPVSALGKLYLVTADGHTLALSRGTCPQQVTGDLHLYQEFCPITPMVASRLVPQQFCQFITDTSQPIHVPRIVFSELQINGLARDPVAGDAHNLPYRNLQHLRDCLQQVATTHKESKLVNKEMSDGVLYRMIKGGFYVGDHSDMAFYPFPAQAELENNHRPWWRSAQTRLMGWR